MPQSVLDLIRRDKPQREETPLEKYRRISGETSAPGGQSVFELIGREPIRPEPQPTALPAPSPGLTDYAAAMVPQPVKTTVSLVLDLLGRPGAATAGAARAIKEGRDVSDAIVDNLRGARRDSFMDVTNDSVVGKAIGFAGDLVIDPLNLAGAAPLKAVKAAGGAAKKVATAVMPDAVQQATRGVADSLGQKFIPRYGTELQDADVAALTAAGKSPAQPGAFKDSLHNFQKERSTIPARVEQRIIERYRGTTKADRDAQTGVMEALEAGAGKTDHVDELMLEQRRVNDDLFAREVAAGVQNPAAYNPDYVPHDYSRTKGATARALNNPHAAINARNRFAKGRQDPERTIQEAVSLGAESDAALAHLTREVTGETAVTTGEFVKSTARRFGLPVDKAPGDWQTLKNLPMEKPLKAEMSEVAFPAYIARELDRLYMPKEKPSQLGRMYDHALRLWKTQATVLRPGFHSTNMQGNLFNGAYLAGALHPARWIEAAQWPWLKARGFPDAPAIGRYSASEVDDFMQKFGVGGATRGFTTELMEEGADKLLIEKLAESSATSAAARAKGKALKFVKHPIRGAAHFGQSLEDFSKRALFFDRLHKGDSLEKAMKTVDRYLFDYSDLTDFERRYARRIIPFYTWMRKNVPLQVQSVLEQPWKYGAIAKTSSAIERDSKEDRTYVREGERLGYLQRGNAIQLPSEGKNRRFWTPYLPYGDLNKVPVKGGTTPMDATREIASALSPAIKAPIELVTNKSLFFDRPLYDADLGPVKDRQRIPASLEFLPDALKELLFTPTQTPQGAEFQTPAAVRYAVEQLSPFTEAVGRAARSATDPEPPNPLQPLGLIAGVRLTQRSPLQVAQDRRAALERTRRTRAKQRQQNRRPVTKAEVKRLREALYGPDSR